MAEVKLFDFGSSYVIERSSKFASIDKKSGQITMLASKPEEQNVEIPTRGVLGMIRLLAGNYLVILKSAKEMEELLPGHKVFALNQVELLQFDKTAKLTDDQKADEEEYKRLVNQLFNGEQSGFYFSYTFDLTNNLQSQLKAGSLPSVANWKNLDDQFLWNRHLAKDFQAAGCMEFIVPVIRGFISINHVKVNDKTVDFILLSRLAWKRVGTRYNIRGVDQQGNVANFVETEQIMRYNDSLSCYMQVRGSIPLVWSQKANLAYKPRAVINVEKQKGSGSKSHIEAIRARYNRLMLINLVDQKGNEKELASAYKELVESLNDENLHYVDYDFHKETKGMKYQNIYNLVKQVEPHTNSFGYFSYDLKTGSVTKKQDGVLRVNCIDCLDRTNVVESVFARIFLNKKLQEVGVFGANDSIDKFANFESTFKTVWADNGDAISIIYTGTGALKADYTRTGKRSFVGLLQDGLKSANRYVLNNFSDGATQDAMNLVLGKYIVDQSSASPFKASRTTVKNIYKVLTIGFFVSLFMVAVNILKLPTDAHFRDRVALLSGWVVFTFILYAVLVRNGRDIVNNPVLKHRKKDV